MKTELKTMADRKVWHLEKAPVNTNVIGCRWVYTLKRDDKGKIVRYKARLVAQGFKQVKGESYDLTFSPVINFGVIRFFFSLLVSNNGWHHTQCDITGAYLYAPLKERIFMSQPPGFNTPGKEDFSCKLEKAIYGLHQSGRMWFFELDKVLIELSFKKFENCNCVYTLGSNVLIVVYVDDIVFFGKTQRQIDEAIKMLERHFDLKVMGQTKKLLGVEFETRDGEVNIHQLMYIEEVYRKFNSFKIPVSSLPISKGSVYSNSNCPKNDSEKFEMSKIPYRNLLGCLSFIAGRTRPDLSYAINIFSQFQANPGITHWLGLLRVLGYLYYTKDLKLHLRCNKAQIIAYSDADFAANRDDRTSMGGEFVLLGNSPVTWRTFKERCVSLSTMEAEFIAITEAAKATLFYDRVLGECFEKGIIKGSRVNATLYADNQAAIDFIRSPVENCRSRHIDVKLFFIREWVFKEEFDLAFVRSKENLADPFTKPLTKHDLLRFIEVLFIQK